jgi:hypothetical protein
MSSAFAAMMKSSKTAEVTEAGFTEELAALVNKHGRDTVTNMPDYMLANHISNYIDTFALVIADRDRLEQANRLATGE